jgi:protein-tyrosine phosphatase
MKQSATPVNPAPETFIVDLPETATVTRKANGEMVLRWDESLGAVRIYAGTQLDAITRDTPIAQLTDQISVTLTGLDPKQRYYVEIVGENGTYIVAERTITLENAPNFRDVGGYPTIDGKQVKWGQIYRAGRLSQLTENDQILLTTLGVKLVCDLRGESETQRSPDNLPAEANISYLATPVTTADNDASLVDRVKLLVFQRDKLGEVFSNVMERAYTHIMIEENTAVIRTILERLADNDSLPAIIHCTAGQDRTGITIALLLRLLGVDEDIVLADYSLSNHAFHDIEKHTDGLVKQLRVFGITSDHLFPLIVADTHRMRRTLDILKSRYGTVEAYLRERVKVRADTIEALKANLLV